MASAVVVRLPRSDAERLEREASRLGIGLEEYVLELLLRNLDPLERAREYAEAARGLLERAREELERGDVRQAAGEAWGAAALAVKAYAAWRDGKRLTSHEGLWEYKRVMKKDLGERVSDAWYAGQSMHVCFYEGWCAREGVEEALERIKRLVEEVEKRVEA
ncbi:PaREP1 family protein [Pyrodictium abyssi]|uniref:PaREP1 family protein n=1 Tax=Pyrodictium abyssi TaxID=54256 RepID=UPI003B97E51B